MAVQIGVIAEEENDVEVLYEITCKLISENTFSFKKFIGHGCGKLRRKCSPWAENLIRRGCNHLVVIHDRDNNDETTIRRCLDNSVKDKGFIGYIILIPIQEIEAWLLSDPSALKQAFKMKKNPKVPALPESVNNPKEHLKKLIWNTCQKRYINTIHNKRIAAEIRLNKLNVCMSFHPYPNFINTLNQN